MSTAEFAALGTPERVMLAGSECMEFISRLDLEFGIGKVPYPADTYEAIRKARHALIDAAIACTAGYLDLLKHGFASEVPIGEEPTP